MDRLTLAQRSRLMSHVRGKNTGPELEVRRVLRAAGLTYRLHRKDLAGRPDIVIPSRGAAIFVHGCFWHGHIGCNKGRLPRSGLDYWEPKIAVTRVRDARNVAVLAAQGWHVDVIWQCQIKEKGPLVDLVERTLHLPIRNRIGKDRR